MEAKNGEWVDYSYDKGSESWVGRHERSDPLGKLGADYLFSRLGVVRFAMVFPNHIIADRGCTYIKLCQFQITPHTRVLNLYGAVTNSNKTPRKYITPLRRPKFYSGYRY